MNSVKFFVYLLSFGDGSYYVGKGSGCRLAASVGDHNAYSGKVIYWAGGEDDAFRMEDKVWCGMIKRGFRLRNRRRPGRYGHCDERSGYGQRFTCRGKCLTISQWASELEVPQQRVSSRLNRGWSVERALFAPKVPYGERFVSKIYLTLMGETLSLSKWARRFGIRTFTLRNRLKKGWNPEKTLLTLHKDHLNVKLTYQGKTQSVNKWAKELNLQPQLIRIRLKKGWSVEKALSKPPAVKLSYGGECLTVRQWAERRRCNPGAIRKRLEKGWSIEAVLSTPFRVCCKS